jgi:hypothetical protein
VVCRSRPARAALHLAFSTQPITWWQSIRGESGLHSPLLLQPEFTYLERLSTESSVDDLGTCRGVVLRRAVSILRSIETQPLTGRFVRTNVSDNLPSLSIGLANFYGLQLPSGQSTSQSVARTTSSRTDGTLPLRDWVSEQCWLTAVVLHSELQSVKAAQIAQSKAQVSMDRRAEQLKSQSRQSLPIKLANFYGLQPLMRLARLVTSNT